MGLGINNSYSTSMISGYQIKSFGYHDIRFGKSEDLDKISRPQAVE